MTSIQGILSHSHIGRLPGPMRTEKDLQRHLKLVYHKAFLNAYVTDTDEFDITTYKNIFI